MIEEHYQELCRTPSDINEHLPTLREYADKCEHVTEFGVRGCVSLHAFLASKASTIVAYDIANVDTPSDCEKLTFICADVLKVDIERTDLLFVDSYHTCSQLEQELALHANKVRRFIALHDTSIFGERGEDGLPGLNYAIATFLLNPNGVNLGGKWREIYRTDANNGLTILERQ